MVVEKNSWLSYHITQDFLASTKIIARSKTGITAGDAINKETTVPHVGLCLGGTSGTLLQEHVFSICILSKLLNLIGCHSNLKDI